MGATRGEVCLGALRSPSFVPANKEVHHLLWLIYRELCHARKAHSFDGVVTKLQVSVLRVWHQEVTDHLVIDFDIGDANIICFLCVLQDLLEHVF